MARGDQIQRHWNLLKLLQTRGAGLLLRDVASELEVSERTIQRDFELLQELGFPLEHEDDEIGRRYWRLPRDFIRSGPLVLSLTEALSLHLARDFFAPLAGTLFAEGLDGLLSKICTLLPQPALAHFRELDRTVYIRRVGASNYQAHDQAIRTLTAAVRERVTVEVRYRSMWRGAEYTTGLDPYGLVYFEGELYVVGRSHRADNVRVFKLTRIDAVHSTERRFEPPVGFSLERHFRSSFGIVQSRGRPMEVVVRFTGPATALIEERVWHESQQLTWEPSNDVLFEELAEEAGAVLATFRLSNLVEFKRWLKGFGAHAEVLRPAALRDEMRAELLAAAQLYS